MAWQGALAVLVSTLLCAAATPVEPKRFLNVEHFVNKKILYNEKWPINDTIVYLACDYDKRIKSDVTCEVIQRDTERRLSCPLSLANVANKYLASHRVARDKALVYYIDSRSPPERRHMKLLNIDLNSCKTREHEVAVPSGESGRNTLSVSETKVVPYADRYDVIFNFAKSRCNGSFCKGTYDLDGNVIREVNDWDKLSYDDKFIVRIASVNPNSPADGYLYITLFKENDKQIGANLDKDDAKLLGSWEFPNNMIIPYYAYSTNDNTIGVCVQFSGKISCKFFDSTDYKVKQKVRLPDEGELLHGVYNLADGFLTLTQACLEPGFHDHVLFCKNQKFFIRRFDSQGKLVKKVAVDDFRWDDTHYSFYGRFFRNDAGDYCATMSVYMLELLPPKPDVPQSVTLGTQCFANLV